MLDSDHFYPPRRNANALMPDDISSLLNGRDFDRKLSDAIRISTVSEDGWPQAVMFRADKVLAPDSSKVAMLVYWNSNTSRNLAGDGGLTLTLPLDLSLCGMRLRATAKNQDGQHRCFSGVLEDVGRHRSHHADVVSGVIFRLYDPSAIVARWSRQVELPRDVKQENG
jgi:hypothetical protein